MYADWCMHCKMPATSLGTHCMCSTLNWSACSVYTGYVLFRTFCFCLQTNLMPTPPAKNVMTANNVHVLIITTFTAEIHVVCYFHVHWTLSLYWVVGLCWWQSVAFCLNHSNSILMEFTILTHGYFCLISCSLYSWLQHMKNQEEVKMEDV